MFTGKDRNKDKNSNLSDNTTQSVGLLKWSLDALLRRKEESPSKKYKEHEETNHNINTLFPESIERNITRSMSLDGFDPSFYQRYDLLHDDRPMSSFSGINNNNKNNNNNNNNNNSDNNFSRSGKLMSPIKLQNDKGLYTDTFLNKKHPLSNEINKDDTDTSLIANLFNKEKFIPPNNNDKPTNNTQTQTLNSTIPIPGKFPKSKDETVPNLKLPSLNNNNSKELILDKSLNEIYNDLNINKSLLTQINAYVNELIEENKQYKTDYSQVKLELLHEMKQCKIIMDRYTELTKKHKELKMISGDTFKMNNQLVRIQNEQKIQLHAKDQRIRQLEIQVNKLNIKLDEKDITINGLRNDLTTVRDQLMDDRNYYESEISKLENSLNVMEERNIINKHPAYI
ncbi:spindle pole component Bbp1p [Monosporozyma unispora]